MKTVSITGFFLMVMFLYPFNEAYPAAIKGGSGGPSYSPEISGGTTMNKETEVIIEVRDNILYTPKNRYNISKVKVSNRPHGNIKPSGKTQTVELIYTNNVLTEVVFQPLMSK